MSDATLWRVDWVNEGREGELSTRVGAAEVMNRNQSKVQRPLYVREKKRSLCTSWVAHAAGILQIPCFGVEPAPH